MNFNHRCKKINTHPWFVLFKEATNFPAGSSSHLNKKTFFSPGNGILSQSNNTCRAKHTLKAQHDDSMSVNMQLEWVDGVPPNLGHQ